jgi:hypothetical protein
LNTIQESRKIAILGTALLTTLLLATPTMHVKAASFTYTNPGETAYVSATNNDANTTFSATALQYIPVLFYGNGTLQNLLAGNGTSLSVANSSSILYLGSGSNFIFGNFSSINATGHNWYVYKSPGALNSSLFNGNFTGGFFQPLNGTYGNLTLGLLLQSMHSQYAFVGTGDEDVFNLVGGITSDAFSVTAPGANVLVNIVPGSGNSTYNINLGTNSSVSITNANSTAFTSLGSTENVYNIIF